MESTGKVKWWNRKLGFGFVVVEGADAFVHYSQVNCNERLLKPEQRVRFVLREGPRGKFAEDVEVVR